MSDLGGRELVTRERPLGTDQHGDPISGAGDMKPFEGCVVYPRYSTELTGRAATLVVGMTALFPDPDADILPTDILHWRGRRYEVDGEPGPWRHLDGEDAALEVAMRGAQG